jgi:CheY-like chemotaxis protein
MACVLVVDDDQDSLEVLSKYMEKAGYETVRAANGWEALIKLDQNDIDLVLLDLTMPGMDGATLLRILRNDNRRRSLPVVLVTAMRDVDLFNRASQLGVNGCLLKASFTAPQLFDTVKMALGTDGATGVLN